MRTTAVRHRRRGASKKLSSLGTLLKVVACVFLLSFFLKGSYIFLNQIYSFVSHRVSARYFRSLEFSVKGGEKTDPRCIQRLVRTHQQPDLLSMNLKALKRDLEGLPWVKTAAVYRQFPQGLMIHFVEHKPFIVWQEKGIKKLLSDDLTLIPSQKLEDFRTLLVVEAPREKLKPLRPFLRKLLELKPLHNVTRQVVVHRHGRIDLLFKGGAWVRLPADGALSSLSLLGDLLSKYPQRFMQIRILDMQQPGKLVVTLNSDP
jgi:cell division protein FtsQ